MADPQPPRLATSLAHKNTCTHVYTLPPSLPPSGCLPPSPALLTHKCASALSAHMRARTSLALRYLPIPSPPSPIFPLPPLPGARSLSSLALPPPPSDPVSLTPQPPPPSPHPPSTISVSPAHTLVPVPARPPCVPARWGCRLPPRPRVKQPAASVHARRACELESLRALKPTHTHMQAHASKHMCALTH